jgi:hypothetical protein
VARLRWALSLAGRGHLWPGIGRQSAGWMAAEWSGIWPVEVRLGAAMGGLEVAGRAVRIRSREPAGVREMSNTGVGWLSFESNLLRIKRLVVKGLTPTGSALKRQR